jgi:hypothetical protein
MKPWSWQLLRKVVDVTVRREKALEYSVQLPPGNWFAPPGSNRSGSGGNKTVGAFDVKGRYQYQFWRYVFVQQYVAKLAMTAIEFPPMQKGAGFNLDAVKEKIAEATKAQQ